MIPTWALPLFGYLTRAIGLTSSVYTVVNVVKNLLHPELGGISYFELGSNTVDTLVEVDSPTHGLAALAALIATARTDILTAIGTPAQTGVAVDVSSGSVDAIGGTVWGTLTGTTPANMFHLMLDLLNFMQIQGEFGTFGKSLSPYVVPGYWATGVSALEFIAASPYPDPLPGDILITDTLGSWLTRECPTYTVSQLGIGSKQWILAKTGAGDVIFVSTLDEAQFAALKALYYPPEPDLSHSAPIWPGLADVTLLTPVAFSGSFSVSGPMQGVLIEITSAPSKQGTFNFDGLVSYRNAGAVTFLSDDGEAELSQPLGFTAAVYCAQSMAAAASVKVRVEPGLTGTCTPFTIP